MAICSNSSAVSSYVFHVSTFHFSILFLNFNLTLPSTHYTIEIINMSDDTQMLLLALVILLLFIMLFHQQSRNHHQTAFHTAVTRKLANLDRAQHVTHTPSRGGTAAHRPSWDDC
jgi:hypothetical protein